MFGFSEEGAETDVCSVEKKLRVDGVVKDFS